MNTEIVVGIFFMIVGVYMGIHLERYNQSLKKMK
jgi:hypothetical protein